MGNILLDSNPRCMNSQQLEDILSFAGITAKIEFSGITREQCRAKIEHLRTEQVPNRSVLLDMPDEAVTEYWFKNWLHPDLKDWVPKQPMDQRGASKHQREEAAQKEFLRTYENGQQNYNYTLADIEQWINEIP